MSLSYANARRWIDKCSSHEKEELMREIAKELTELHTKEFTIKVKKKETKKERNQALYEMGHDYFRF